jgi:hypothetical protein
MDRAPWQAVVNLVLQRSAALTADQWLHLAEILVLLWAGLVAWRQLRSMQRQIRAAHEQTSRQRLLERRSQALSFSLVNSPYLLETRGHLEKAFPSPRWSGRTIPLAEIRQALDGDRLEYMKLVALLAHWENLALTVFAGPSEEDMALEMVGSTLVDHVIRMAEFIKERRRTENPRLHAYLLPLAARWWERLAKEKGKTPVFQRRECCMV